MTIKAMRDELNAQREERETLANVRRTAVDRLKVELRNCGRKDFDEDLLREAAELSSEKSQSTMLKRLLVLEKLTPLKVPI